MVVSSISPDSDFSHRRSFIHPRDRRWPRWLLGTVADVPYIILPSYKYDGSNEVTSLPRINGANRQSTQRVRRIGAEERDGKGENERVTPAGVARLIEILITAAPVNERIRGSCRGSTNCMSCLKLAVCPPRSCPKDSLSWVHVEKQKEKIERGSSAKLIGRNCSGGQLQSANSLNDEPRDRNSLPERGLPRRAASRESTPE